MFQAKFRNLCLKANLFEILIIKYFIQKYFFPHLYAEYKTRGLHQQESWSKRDTMDFSTT